LSESTPEAPCFFGIPPPRMSDPMCGKISPFPLEALIVPVIVAGLEPHPATRTPKATRRRHGGDAATPSIAFERTNMQLILILGIVVAIVAVVFALQNNLPVVVAIALWSFEGSLALVLLVSLGLGALIAGLLSSPAVIRGQWTTGRLHKQVADLERQLAAQQQRSRELEAEVARLSPASAGAAPVAEKPYVGLKTLIAGTGTEKGSP
jgi:uncharacterized integral membrane protein